VTLGRTFAGLLLVIAGAATASLAQQLPDPNQSGYKDTPAQQAEHEFMIYVRCVATRRYERARNVVLAPFGSSEQDKAFNKAVLSVGDPCLRTGFGSVHMNVRPDVLAGGLAQALVTRDFPDLPTVIEGAAVDADRERQRVLQLTPTERFGRCIVWRDPAAVQALLRADPRSPGERQAVQTLKRNMGYCLVEGSTLRINAMFLRSATAIAAYRLGQEISPRGARGASAAGAGRTEMKNA